MTGMAPTVHANIHILSDRPAVSTGVETYPSIRFSENNGGKVDYADLIVTVTGELEDRRAFAAELRRAADEIEQWERPPYEPFDESDTIAEAVPA